LFKIVVTKVIQSRRVSWFSLCLLLFD